MFALRVCKMCECWYECEGSDMCKGVIEVQCESVEWAYLVEHLDSGGVCV